MNTILLMLNNLDKIKEFSYVTGTYPELDLLLCNDDPGGIESWYFFDYTYVIFLDLPDKKEIIYTSQPTSEYSQADTTFVNYILNLDEISLSDLIYLCTLYGQLATEDDLFKTYEGQIPFLKDYLRETYGRLVYKQQAIDLLRSYSNFSSKEAESTIRNLIDRDEAGRRTMKVIIENDYSFWDLWNEYTFGNRVYRPRLPLAKKLKRLLTEP